MRDPYDVLGVSKGANPADIKKAYRRLAKKLHPDANKKDVKAAAKFAELNTAYEIVGDEDKRKAFDRGEIDAEGKPRFQGFTSAGPGAGRGGAGFGPGSYSESFSWGPEGMRRAGGQAGGFGRFEDVLSEMFGGFASGRAQPNARSGSQFESGHFEMPRGQDITATVSVTLAEAVAGTKKRVRLPAGKDVDVKIPAGLAEGQQIRLKGQGMVGPGGAAGDVLITIAIAPHPFFKVDGNDLRADLPITLYEAVLGAKIRVPTLDGAVDLAVPAGTSAGRTFRLKGKGIPAKGHAGDLFVTTRIVLPDQHDPELDELMRRWRNDKPYNPRQ